MFIYQSQLHFSIQGQESFNIKNLLQYLIQACGGYLSASYQAFMDWEITETLYHLYVYIDLKEQENANHNQSKLAKWGQGWSDDDFN